MQSVRVSSSGTECATLRGGFELTPQCSCTRLYRPKNEVCDDALSCGVSAPYEIPSCHHRSRRMDCHCLDSSCSSFTTLVLTNEKTRFAILRGENCVLATVGTVADDMANEPNFDVDVDNSSQTDQSNQKNECVELWEVKNPIVCSKLHTPSYGIIRIERRKALSFSCSSTLTWRVLVAPSICSAHSRSFKMEYSNDTTSEQRKHLKLI